MRLVYERELGILLAHPAEIASAAAAEIARHYAGTRQLVLGDGLFRSVAPWEAEDLDIVEMAMAGSRPDHVGIIAGAMVLHSRIRTGSHRTPLAELRGRIISAWSPVEARNG